MEVSTELAVIIQDRVSNELKAVRADGVEEMAKLLLLQLVERHKENRPCSILLSTDLDPVWALWQALACERPYGVDAACIRAVCDLPGDYTEAQKAVVAWVSDVTREMRNRVVALVDAGMKQARTLLPGYYHDERICWHCDRETLHVCKDSRHERDSSADFQECTVCKWYRTGMFGDYRPPDR